jgi:hypothetical protein
MEKKMNLKKAVDWAKYHLIDSTALVVATNPIFCALESTVGRTLGDMTDDVSISARAVATATVFGGVGTAFARGRDLSKRFFKITDETREIIHTVHDTLYPVAFNMVISPPMYALSQYLAEGEITPRAVATGTGIAMGLAPFIGYPAGYAIDTFRDMFGLEECKRKYYPDLIRRQKGSIKKGLAALLTASSIATMAGIYALTPNGEETDIAQPTEIHETLEEIGEGK